MLVGLLNVDLDESARQLLHFPGSGRLTRAQANDHVLPAGRLAWVERDVLDDPIALVENSKDCDTLRHRRYAAFSICRRGRLAAPRQGHIWLIALAARAQRKRDDQRCRKCPHAYSGIQGS